MGKTALHLPFRLYCTLGRIKFSLIFLLEYPQERGLENGALDKISNSARSADGLEDGMELKRATEQGTRGPSTGLVTEMLRTETLLETRSERMFFFFLVPFLPIPLSFFLLLNSIRCLLELVHIGDSKGEEEHRSVLVHIQIINKHVKRSSPGTEELKLLHKYLQRVLSKGQTWLDNSQSLFH